MLESADFFSKVYTEIDELTSTECFCTPEKITMQACYDPQLLMEQIRGAVGMVWWGSCGPVLKQDAVAFLDNCVRFVLYCHENNYHPAGLEARVELVKPVFLCSVAPLFDIVIRYHDACITIGLDKPAVLDFRSTNALSRGYGTHCYIDVTENGSIPTDPGISVDNPRGIVWEGELVRLDDINLRRALLQGDCDRYRAVPMVSDYIAWHLCI